MRVHRTIAIPLVMTGVYRHLMVKPWIHFRRLGFLPIRSTIPQLVGSVFAQQRLGIQFRILVRLLWFLTVTSRRRGTNVTVYS